MSNTTHPGRYIVIEGAPASGKTTQVQLLAERLTALGYKVKVFTSTTGQVSLDYDQILSAKNQGYICLSTYNFLSPLIKAYYADKTENDYQKLLQTLSAEGSDRADLVLVLDVPAADLKQRLSNQPGDHDLSLNYLENMRTGYLWEAKQRGYKLIYAFQKPSVVQEDICKALGIYDPPVKASEPTSQATPLKQIISAKSVEKKPIEQSQQKTKTLQKNTYLAPTELTADLRQDFKITVDEILKLKKQVETKLINYYKSDIKELSDRKKQSKTIAAAIAPIITIKDFKTRDFSSSNNFVDSFVNEIGFISHDIEPGAKMSRFWPRNELNLVSQLYYQDLNLSSREAEDEINKLAYGQKSAALIYALKNGFTERLNNSLAGYELEVMSDFNAYLTLNNLFSITSRQAISPKYGFETPDAIEAAGAEDDHEKCFALSLKLYDSLNQHHFGSLAEQACLAGHLFRYKLIVEPKDIAKLKQARKELKSNNSTRKILKQMVDQISEVHPLVFDYL